MKLGSRRTFLAATMVAAACLVGSVAVRAQAPPAPAQSGDAPILSEQAFKNIQTLKGIPVDTFLDAMGMFANAMGNDCTFCHSPQAALDRAGFAVQTPRMARARQMIAMMNTINNNFFKGERRVTCFTCHGGNQSPRSDPNLALQYATPVEDPNVRDFPTDPKLVAKDIFDKYIKAVGGADKVAALKSYTGKGTYEGFDTLKKVPVEIYAKAPNQYTTIVHMDDGPSVRTFDGRTGWMAGPDTAVPLLTLTSGNLDRARLEALVAFPTSLPQAYTQWRAGRAVLNDEEDFVLQASENGQPVLNLYFAPSGLLVRLVRWTPTPVGMVPTQIDYADFRDVAGVKVPFHRTVSQTYMRMDVELSDIQPNAAIEASRFARPVPKPRG
jgi:photosynthetic reaction center cytochrome c subunit